jgi:hypothetical protein
LPPLISGDILAVQTIEELVVPGEPDHIANTANQFLEHVREMQVSQPEEIQDQVSGVSYAAINSASSISQHFHFGARQSTEVILDSLNLEQNSMLVNQERAQEYNSQIANNLAIVPAKPGTTAEHNDRVQKEVITNILVSGLRQIMSNQLNIQGSRPFGSLAVPDSIIRIDLAALGINSLNITVSVPSQGNILEPRTANNIVPVLEVQRHQNNMIVTRTTPITKVYYRRKFRKNKSSQANMRNNQMQEERAPIFPEPVEDYMVTHEQLDEQDYSTRKPLSRKRKCSTPVSAKKLRRSDRLNKALDGHKPKQASPPKG